MAHRIFLAGAAGVIGRRLAPLLIEAGHHVTGTTRSDATATALRDAGVTPVVIDIFDAKAVEEAVKAARPDVIVHQLTDLGGGDPFKDPTILERNARIRREGTPNLVRAALEAGVSRIVAQSIAFAYAPGPVPQDETAPLDLAATGTRSVSVGGVVALEHAVLETPGVTGVVLRYGLLYGPGAGSPEPKGPSPVHVDAAAQAALLALDAGSGIYNITDPGSDAIAERAERELGWSPAFRLPAAIEP